MLANAKYVITSDGKIIMFDNHIDHSTYKSENIISAGFIDMGTFKDGTVSMRCYGESLSLNLQSRPYQDTSIALKRICGVSETRINDKLSELGLVPDDD